MVLAKPSGAFDRDSEWAAISRFVADPSARLGVVWGPRRVGKSYLLGSACEAAGGLYVQAIREDVAPFLVTLGERIAEHAHLAAPLRLDDWASALDALLDLPDTPVVVLDEFPYLVESDPRLPTIVQRVVDRRGARRSRVILCGSAISQMTSLFASDAPLYRRASLSLSMRPFGFADSARYWRLRSRSADALLVHAVVGGTPGYRDVLGDVGRDVDRWIVERVLDPYSVLFHEDDLALAMDPTLSDAAVYRSILAAVSAGERTPSGIARFTGRKATSLVRPLDRLVDAGMLVRTGDPLRAKRSLLDVGDPFLRFHFQVIRPNKAAIARGRAASVWAAALPRFRSQVFGPHFERVCRESVLDADLGLPEVSEVGATTIYDSGRSVHEVDVVGTDEAGAVRLIGEAKASGAARTIGDLQRLDRIRELIPAARRSAEVHLALFATSGFDATLRRAAARRPDVHLIGLDTLVGA